MNLRIPLTVVAFFLGTALVLSAAQMPTAKTLTVGEFAMLVAGRVHEGGSPLEATTPEEAVASLQRLGVRIRPDLSSPLTEADAAGLFEQFGISLRAQSPDSLLSPDRAASLIGIFGASLASASSRLEMTIDTKASGSSRATLVPEAVDEEPWWPFPQSPADCRVLWPSKDCTSQVCRNPCQYCCLKQLGHNGTVCGHLCQKKNLIVTPEEPTP